MAYIIPNQKVVNYDLSGLEVTELTEEDMPRV